MVGLRREGTGEVLQSEKESLSKEGEQKMARTPPVPGHISRKDQELTPGWTLTADTDRRPRPTN